MSTNRIQFISKNKNGDYYVGFLVPVQRGIKGKNKGKVDELLIVGVPKNKFPSWCKEHGIEVKEIKEKG